ncbi:MAG TPA: L,D-transpeptidase family protein [Beijerinckiaceae bacterium]|jgi:murein L,D-transpeptidase YafK
MAKRIVIAASLALALAACDDQTARSTRHLSPIPPQTLSLMAEKGMSRSDPILVRAYKKESELEVWKRGSDGKYAHLKTYPICRWSGQLGPKVREGDRQAPEGFYTVTPAQMNPNSAYYLSFDTGYPNAYDRAHGRTGAHLMVHGTCSSRGCFAMTDEAIAEVYAIARDAFSGGQRGFQFQSYPFRMTAENLAKHRADPHIAFWKNLKEGSDYFEVMKEEPKVAVQSLRYAFGSDDPTVVAAVAEKRAEDERKVAELVAKGVPAVRIVYEDGGTHASFREAMVASAGGSGGDEGSAFAVLQARPRRNLGDVSRPDALAMGPREIEIPPATDKTGKPGKPSTALAFAGAKPAPAATTTVARSAPSSSSASLAASPTAGESKSLYDRVFGNLFGSKTSEPETTAEQPSAVPLPPRRGAAAKPPERRAAIAQPRVN